MSYVVYETYAPWWRRAYVPPFRSRWPRYRYRRRWGLLGLGEVKDWWQLWQGTDEVYIWRARLRGVQLKHPDQALAFVRAVGKANNTGLDVRGVALSKITDTEFDVDIVLTTAASGPNVVVTNAQGVANKLMADSELRQQFPQLTIDGPKYLQLVGPPQAVDHWRSQPLLWDHNLGPQGGPTDTFAQPVEYSVVMGTAEDGKLAQPWVQPKPGLQPPPKGGGTGGPEQDTLIAAGIVVVGLFAVSKILGSKRKKG
jgi:hypothetical protein